MTNDSYHQKDYKISHPRDLIVLGSLFYIGAFLLILERNGVENWRHCEMTFAVISLQFAVISLQLAVINLQFAVISLQFAMISLQNVHLL